MALIDWPAALVPQQSEWQLKYPISRGQSQFTGAVEVKLMGPPRWAFTMSAPPTLARRVHTGRKGESRLAWEAFVRRLRAGVNTVTAWDMRTPHVLGFDAQAPALPWQMLAMSSHWQHWQRVLPVGTVVGDVLTVGETNSYLDLPALPFESGQRYCLSCDVRSSTGAQVALGLSETPFGSAGALFTGAGEVVNTFGGARAGSFALEDGWNRAWVSAPALASGYGPVHVYAVTTGSGQQLQARRPQVGRMGPMPVYIASDGAPVLAPPMPRPVVEGAGQTGDRLEVCGWVPGSHLQEALYFSVAGELKQLLADAVADEIGCAELWFDPPLRRSPSAGAALTIVRPTAEFRLMTQDAGISQMGPVGAAFDLSFEEVVR